MHNTTPKILIVDDERFNITILVNLLKDEYKTIVAKSGEEALKRVATAIPPDLILLDIMMPGMDGYEVCRRLKADEQTSDIPVIFVTAMGEPEDEAKGLELGAIDYLTKPISPPIVKVRVRNHLALKFARQQLEAQNRELIEAAQLREDVERISRHDLKNPLNAIIVYPQILRESGDNLRENQLKYIRKIETSGLRMLTMINRSLDLFKMERGIYPLQPVQVDLVAVIKKNFADLHRPNRAEKPRLRLILNTEPVADGATCYIRGEELLCYSMLANLIKNALEASPDEEHVTVALETDNEATLIHIHNNGVVPEQIRDRFFEKYITAGKSGGTGLGTYSARLIAETLDGSIGMTSSEQAGTTVTIRFPKVSSKDAHHES